MLFNKNSAGSDELKELTGFMYAYNQFDNIKTDIELAHEDMVGLIGTGIMGVAQTHYDSDNWKGAEHTLLNNLVNYIRLPLAYYAIKSFTENTDVSHEDSGRKVKIDDAHEKLPWQWMLDKDEKAILKKAHKTTDRLIAFLDKNIEGSSFATWKNSAERKAIRGQFIDSAEMFNQIYPIDNSRRFFLTISPFIREAERKYIKPALTPEVFDDMKTALAGPAAYTDPDEFLPYIRVPLALFAMSIAVDRLAIEILPEGVFQNLVSDRLTQNAKQPAATEVKREVSKDLMNQARAELNHLQEYIRKLVAEDAGEDFTDRDLTQGLDEDNKYARV